MQITIDLEKIKQFSQESGKIFLSADAEDVLLKLIEAQKTVENAISEAKKIIEEEGLKLNPNFKGIQSDNLRIGYRYFGAEYKIDESRIEELPKELYEVKKYYSVNTPELKKFVEEHDGIPLGIVKIDRQKTVTISVKGDQDEE